MTQTVTQLRHAEPLVWFAKQIVQEGAGRTIALGDRPEPEILRPVLGQVGDISDLFLDRSEPALWLRAAPTSIPVGRIQKRLSESVNSICKKADHLKRKRAEPRRNLRLVAISFLHPAWIRPVLGRPEPDPGLFFGSRSG